MTNKLPFPERVLNQHIFTLGKTGSGKSSALRDIAEHQLERLASFPEAGKVRCAEWIMLDEVAA